MLHNRVCADPQILNQSFGITLDCSINSSGTIYNIIKDVTSLDVIRGSINPVANNCKQFYLARNCSMGALNTSIATVKSISAVFHFNYEEKVRTTEQYVSLMEGFGICHKHEKRDNIYKWLEPYYYFENFMSIALLSISIVLELLLLIVYVTMKKTRNIPDKILIAFCVSLLICDVIGVTSSLIKASVNRVLFKTIALVFISQYNCMGHTTYCNFDVFINWFNKRWITNPIWKLTLLLDFSLPCETSGVHSTIFCFEYWKLPCRLYIDATTQT